MLPLERWALRTGFIRCYFDDKVERIGGKVRIKENIDRKHLCTIICMCICVCTRTYVRIFVGMRTRVDVRLREGKDTYIYIYIYIYRERDKRYYNRPQNFCRRPSSSSFLCLHFLECMALINEEVTTTPVTTHAV